VRLLFLLLALLLVACVEPVPAQLSTPTPPDGTHFAASIRGTVYYDIGCDAWTRLAPANVRFFRTAEEARAAGLRQSTQPGCGAGDVASERATRAVSADPGVCTVERVIDGDTLVCDGGDRIRLLLIDAPELSQGRWGEAARAELLSLAPLGTAVRVERDVQLRDRFGRTLAYLWLDDGRMVNEELLRAGVAVVAVYPPNVRHVERLRAAVVEAREEKAGLWVTPAFECAPSDHRAGRC
jgi:endonuclease YncB( thermonuclease family)